MKIRVYYEDTDAGGIVYHTNYIKYCERARSEIFFSKGMMPFEGDRSGFVVRRIEADYLGMARLGDLLEVTTEVIEIKRSSVSLRQTVYNESGAEIFAMRVLLIYVEKGRVRKIPEKFFDIFQDMTSV